MQNVSASYEPYPLERWSNMRVVFELVDIDAAEDATPTATSEAEISKLLQTHDRNIEMTNKIGTLEQDQILLDGSYSFPDADNGQVGWWSGEISDSNGVLQIPQILEFNFTESQSSVGFMVIFDDKADEYASDFKIETFDSLNALLSEDNVVGNTKHQYISELPSDGYKKVRITFNKTHKPYRRVRVCEVVFGIIQTFDGGNTTNLKLLYEISPTMESLPSNELSITIENIDRKYNMINPKGIYKFLQEGQGLSAEIGVGEKNSIERVNMGKFYFTSSTAEDASMTAQIVAHDKVYDLDGSICRIGQDGTWTVSQAVDAVLLDSGLDIIVTIPTIIGDRLISRCIPQDTSHRQALRMIAQAGMSVCYFNRGGGLVFADLTEGTIADTLDNSNLHAPAKISVSERINAVEIVARNDYHYNSWDNKIETLENIYTATNKETGETDKVKSISNPLVNSNVVAEWLLEVFQKRIRYDLQGRGNPATELTDTVKIYDAYGENRNAIIVKQEYHFDGTLNATEGAI